MITVQRVNPDKVYEVWSEVKDFLEASIETNTGDCTLDQLKLLLTQGLQHLLVGMQEDKIVRAHVCSSCSCIKCARSSHT